MDPITLALATFGVQKLRGQSTKRAFRDALIVGGIGQLGSMTNTGANMGLKGFGGFGGKGALAGSTLQQQAGNTQAWQWGKVLSRPV